MDLGSFRSEFIHLAHAMHDSARRVVGPASCQRLGLTPQQLFALVAVRENPGAPTGSISDSAGILRTNFAQVCRKLEDAGLVERRRSDEDRRVMRLELTERGREVLGSLDRIVDERLGAQLAAEGPERAEDVVRSVRVLREFVDRLG